jgi:CheY-like chemotaxis protein
MSVSPKNILLVEDDASMRRFIEVILKREGYQTISAADGLEGLQIALENTFDAVVADAIMPNMSGYDLCRMLRQNPQYQSKPFILLSGLENNGDANLADAYLLKGNNLKNDLTEKLSELLS